MNKIAEKFMAVVKNVDLLSVARCDDLIDFRSNDVIYYKYGDYFSFDNGYVSFDIETEEFCTMEIENDMYIFTTDQGTITVPASNT